jgi:hypothetical protein
MWGRGARCFSVALPIHGEPFPASAGFFVGPAWNLLASPLRGRFSPECHRPCPGLTLPRGREFFTISCGAPPFTRPSTYFPVSPNASNAAPTKRRTPPVPQIMYAPMMPSRAPAQWRPLTPRNPHRLPSIGSVLHPSSRRDRLPPRRGDRQMRESCLLQADAAPLRTRQAGAHQVLEHFVSEAARHDGRQ